MADPLDEAVHWPGVLETRTYWRVVSCLLVYLDSTFSPHVAMWLLLGRASSSYGCHGSLHNRMA